MIVSNQSRQDKNSLHNVVRPHINSHTPSVYDKDLTIGHIVNNYMDRSVDLIREITKTDKVLLAILGTPS